jgi:period circadian protein
MFFFFQEHCHGVKRSGSHSWEGEPHKASKHPHVEGGGSGGGSVTQCLDFGKQYPVVGNVPPLYQSGPNMNLWPPFSVTVTPLQPTAPCSTYG